LNQGDNAPAKTADMLATAFSKEGEAVRAYQSEEGEDGISVGIILRVGQRLLGAMVANHSSLATEGYEEYLILVRTFAQNLAALWHNLYLLNETQQRAHELEILHGRYLDSIWNTLRRHPRHSAYFDSALFAGVTGVGGKEASRDAQAAQLR
jgi:hypothetical protein